MKYIIVENLKQRDPKVRYPIIFPDFLCHDQMVPSGYEAISAGFLGLDPTKCFGKSETLKLESSIYDTNFINCWLEFDNSMLVIASSIYDND